MITDRVMEVLSARVPEAFFDAVQNEVEITEYQISDPYPPASMPGHPPHLRSGRLFVGLHHFMTADTHALTETVVSHREGRNADVPQDLEFGHGSVEPRPYMSPMISRVREDFLPDLAQRLHF